jgi:2-dehydro-3-deoxyphosphogalactonate aldolase
MTWGRLLETASLVAILRGVTPKDAVSIATALCDAGIACLEVPLNSPEPLRSIELIRGAHGDALLVGAGTVLTVSEVNAVAAAGGQFVVSPNTDTVVIDATKRRDLHSVPGFFTPTEALAAARAGADVLKFFPADGASPSHLKALKAVLPTGLPVFAVGGVTVDSMAVWSSAGAAGFGVGGALYRPGDSPSAVHARATALVSALRAVSS